MNRRQLREQIFKLLFRVEFNPAEDMDTQVELFFDNDDTQFDEKDMEYIRGKYDRIYGKIDEIDRLIDEKAKGWKTERMSKVDLTIIRLGVYEILYDDQISAGIAINEAVELAKKFGQDKSGGFINAVLAKFTTQKEE
ncbi:MAG: transcription antitermination factor NusB [Lachnospiraceae bacterium]|nr:transcription antitermination factor NusB [Lachnospiraceae bacterium]